MSSVRTNHSHH